MVRRRRWQDVVGDAGVVFVGVALFPRLGTWWTRARLRDAVAYAAVEATLLFTVRTWLVPVLERFAEQQERVADELRHELGREPTREEVMRRIQASRAAGRP
jgi:hypothetical protein